MNQNTMPNDDTDSEGGDIDITKLSPLQLAANLMTSLLVEALNALKTNPSTENLTVARQTLQGLRYPIEPMDDIDAGLAQELKQRYLKAIHKAINEAGPTPALMREVLRYQTAVGLLSPGTAQGSALGTTGTAQGRLGHGPTPLVERLESATGRAMTQGEQLTEQLKAEVGANRTELGEPLMTDEECMWPFPADDYRGHETYPVRLSSGAWAARSSADGKAELARRAIGEAVESATTREPEGTLNMVERETGGAAMMRESDYADLPFVV